MLNKIINTPNDDPIIDFQVKTPLVANLAEIKRTSTNEGPSSGKTQVDGLVEDCDTDSDDDDVRVVTRGLGYTSASASSSKRNVVPKPKTVFSNF